MGLSISRAFDTWRRRSVVTCRHRCEDSCLALVSLAIDVVSGKIQLLSFCFAIFSPLLLLLLAAAAADSRLRTT